MPRIAVALCFLMALQVSAVQAEFRPAPLQCPPDVHSPDYEDWQRQATRRLGFSIEPQIPGTRQDAARIVKRYAALSAAGRGVEIVFADRDFGRLSHRCNDACTRLDCETALRACARELDSRYFDVAVLLDGKGQCLVIPKP